MIGLGFPLGIWATGTLVNVGIARFALKSFLFMTMMGLVAKMALRIGLNIKYILVLPGLNI